MKLQKSEVPATVIDERGARDTQVTVIQIPGELRNVTEIVGPDGGVSFVGFDENGRRVTITLKETRLRLDGGTR